MRTTYIPSCILLLGIASCSGDGDKGPEACGDVKTPISPIINGDPIWDPTVITITENQADAVGFLNLGGRAACTGTLIAPRTVLTAGHCVFSRPSYIQFITGDNYTMPEHVYDATSWNAHPYYGGRYVDYDLAIVQLARDPAEDGVQPIPVHLEPMQSLAGEEVQAVGYGMTRADSYGNTRKWWTVLTVTREYPTIFQVTGFDSNGTCQGDSGGPLLYNDTVNGTMVHGALSSGDSDDCLGNSFYPRTDHPDNAAFIRSFLPEDPCEGETLEGRCESGSAIWCDDTGIIVDTCEEWETCQDNGEGLYRCVATDPCRGETFEGRCLETGEATWCEDGGLYIHGCPDFGYWCGMNSEGLYRCLPPGPCQAEGLDWNGICTADGHARWCEGGEVKDRDCWKCDQDCGWAGDQLGNYCIDR